MPKKTLSPNKKTDPQNQSDFSLSSDNTPITTPHIFSGPKLLSLTSFPDSTPTPAIQPTISRQEAQEILNRLDIGRMETAAVDGKRTTYIKELVHKLHPIWWAQILDDLNAPKDSDRYRTAIVEMNKLQCRVLPTEVGQSADSDAITLNITNFVKPIDNSD